MPMLSYKIASVERVSQPGAYSLVYERQVLNNRNGYDARVDVLADGVEIGTLHLDRIDGEVVWHVSAQFRSGCSMPKFMHGLFSRCTAPLHPVDELADLLNDEIAYAEMSREQDAEETR